jgi:uncharacterized membrane protein YjjP (DUF1212 family)
VEGTNKAHENGEAMGFVGVRLTVMLGHGYWLWVLHFMCEAAVAYMLSGAWRTRIISGFTSITVA